MSESAPYEPDQLTDPEPPESWRNDGQELLATGLKLFVLEPLDFLLKAPTLVPKLIHEGRREWRKQSTIARFVGKSVVDKARRRRAGALRVTVVMSLPEPVPVTPVIQPVPPSVAAADLPISGYDTLPAQAIVDLLGDLRPADLLLIRRHESANRRRRTVLSGVAQLLGDG